MIHLEDIRSLTIAHTDKGDFFIYEEKLTREFIVQGKVLRKRAGLVFIQIDEETFSCSSQLNVNKDDCVECVIRAEPLIQDKKTQENNTTNQTNKHNLKNLQTSQAKFIIQSITQCT